MKTPEEIKKGLGCCIAKGFASCNSECPYWEEGTWCRNVMHSDVSTYIQRLEGYLDEEGEHSELLDIEVNQLKNRLAQVERERDALWFDLACMPNACDVCVHGVQNDNDCDELFGHNSGCDFKWRGVCAENAKERDVDAQSAPDP